MISTLILTFGCLILNMIEAGCNDMDLQGKTLRITDGDVAIFDGRTVRNGSLVIAEGSFLIHVKKEGAACLVIGDNTELVVDGVLQLAPNSFKSYDMIRIVGNNVKIHGRGSITGDRYKHTGRDGEWGMGIRLDGANDVSVSGITIADCWGDCIYVGGGSKDVQISDCLLRGSRRQGISMTKADGVTISSCTIANISGTSPQYAIDIEPNRQCTVDNVLIDHVTVTGCEGGFRATLGKRTIDNARIGKVEIRNCRVSAKSRHTIHLAGCEQAVVNDCTIETRKGEKPILARKVGRLSDNNNKVIHKDKN